MADDRRSAMEVVKASKSLAYGLGAVTLAAGIVLIFWPSATLKVIAVIVGVFMIIGGGVLAFAAATTHRAGTYWGLLLVRGLINVFVGFALIFWPGITVQVIVWLIGLDLVLFGILGLVASRSVPSELDRSGITTQSAITIVFGVVLMLWPDATIRVITLVVGLSLAALGAIFLWSGRELGKAESDLR
jgi:uncharacterized membrane protein HdeD (DUF308 family)